MPNITNFLSVRNTGTWLIPTDDGFMLILSFQGKADNNLAQQISADLNVLTEKPSQ